MKRLTDQLKFRFHRNIIIPEIGEKGQEKLLSSSVLVVGCGGLGSASLYYLAAAGVGRLGLVDSDKVELSNLQRQIIHNINNIGMYKTDSASEKLKKLFPEIEIEKFTIRLDASNIRKIFSQYDVMIDATDNFSTRYLMNHAAHLEKKPVVMGAVYGFSGQVTTVIPGDSACYRCLFPKFPPPKFFDTGDVPGIIGTSPGIIGMIQATEALKIILGMGNVLKNKLLLYDGLDMLFDYLKYHRDSGCCVCGDNPSLDLNINTTHQEVE